MQGWLSEKSMNDYLNYQLEHHENTHEIFSATYQGLYQVW